jgi:hypothetical protein
MARAGPLCAVERSRSLTAPYKNFNSRIQKRARVNACCAAVKDTSEYGAQMHRPLALAALPPILLRWRFWVSPCHAEWFWHTWIRDRRRKFPSPLFSRTEANLSFCRRARGWVMTHCTRRYRSSGRQISSAQRHPRVPMTRRSTWFSWTLLGTSSWRC